MADAPGRVVEPEESAKPRRVGRGRPRGVGRARPLARPILVLVLPLIWSARGLT